MGLFDKLKGSKEKTEEKAKEAGVKAKEKVEDLTLMVDATQYYNKWALFSQDRKLLNR